MESRSSEGSTEAPCQCRSCVSAWTLAFLGVPMRSSALNPDCNLHVQSLYDGFDGFVSTTVDLKQRLMPSDCHNS